MANDVTILGETRGRQPPRKFGIRQADRLHHMYIIGETGVGKTTLLESMIRQDIAAGVGCALIDPHGDLAQRIRDTMPEAHADRLLYIDIADDDLAIGYNPLTRVSAPYRPLVASGLLSVMKKMWPDAWGVRMEHILRNTLLALLDQPKADLADVLSILIDKRFRQAALLNVQNEQVRLFWTKEFAGYSPRFVADSIAPIQNKVGAFLADPRLRKFVRPEGAGLRLRQIMDEGRMLIVNLAKGKLGDDSSSILGGMLVTAIGLAALSRSDVPEATRRPFFLYLDEFQNVTTLALAEMLSELRKYGVGLAMAHQYFTQLEPAVRDAVLGNAGTVISFRIGANDAAIFAQHLGPEFEPIDLMRLSNRQFDLRLLIDGAPSKPFSASASPVPPLG